LRLWRFGLQFLPGIKKYIPTRELEMTQSNSTPLDFQSIILKLQQFWADQGCLLWQPYYSQVGAGTWNPATFLRVLGPEPWNVAYVEPSVRPDDGRYGENPNRLQMHYQFQVILKPCPDNPQDLYLQSLKTVGIDPRLHDIRFVEDNWEQATLSAWGLGWEVWLDGQEITQYTYFQQVGGQTLDPIAVEYTYGLDRILIAVQNAPSVWETPWNPAVKYGDVRQIEEFEHSKYYFEIADIARTHQMYSLYESEVEACLAQGLVLPAYDHLIKCSHAFNVLDARGAIGVTERQAFISRTREMARRVAVAYLEQRQRLEYPFLKDTGEGEIRGKGQGGKSSLHPGFYPQEPSPLLFEIGVEELPASDLEAALEQLKALLPALLDDLRLAHGEVRVLGTPRRLVAYVEDIAPRQPDLEQVVKGPPAARAYDSLGQPTQAAEGFARGKGLSVRDLQVREMDGGQYVVAVLRQAGKPAGEVLAGALPGLIASIKFDKSMRWNASNVAFSRPIRWLLALLGNAAIPCEYAGVRSTNTTYGLRFHEPAAIGVPDAAHYFAALAGQGILLDPTERRAHILAQVKEIASQVGGTTPDDPGLLAEVANLVELPTALLGSFDPEHLKLPREVLISVMKKHQRYFPLIPTGQNGSSGTDGGLLPYFVVIRNGDTQGLDLVRDGNEHVIRARFADAAFFVREDLKRKLEDYLPRLGTLTFQVKLGSILDKTRRVTQLAGSLGAPIGLSPQEQADALRAAELCKADLATKMVVEMTSLQGVMGRVYARLSGEREEVAAAIFEHYLPRYAGDALPESRPGLVVSLADRLDSLVGLFAAGLAPTGAKDPFAQRRAALGLVQTLSLRQVDFDLRLGVEAAKALLPIPMSAESLAACLSFIVERLRNALLEQGWKYDIVDAVLAAQGHNPARAVRSVQELTAWVSRADWSTILPAYARCVRITRDQKTRFAVQPAAFVEAPENELFAALQAAESKLDAVRAAGPVSADACLQAFLPMISAINHFFDMVLVMAEEPAVRQNRLGLLQRIAALTDDVADLSKLEGF
jgi:glycyl-tRNA synthetase